MEIERLERLPVALHPDAVTGDLTDVHPGLEGPALTGVDDDPDLLAVITRPYDDHPGRDRYTLPPEPEQVVRNTFCGT